MIFRKWKDEAVPIELLSGGSLDDLPLISRPPGGSRRVVEVSEETSTKGLILAPMSGASTVFIDLGSEPKFEYADAREAATLAAKNWVRLVIVQSQTSGAWILGERVVVESESSP